TRSRWPRRFQPRLFDHLARRHRRGRTFGEAPAAVLVDADRDRFVPVAIEMREDRGCGGEGYLVFAGAAAVENTDAKTLHDNQDTGERCPPFSMCRRSAFGVRRSEFYRLVRCL